MVTLTGSSSIGGNMVTANAGASKTATTDKNFDEQLSLALAESLRRLGVEAGEVNISVRNNGGAAGRQIVITYGAVTSDAAPASSPTPTSPTTTAWTNPFLPPPPGIATSQPAAPAATPAAVSEASWAPWDGPRDRRDATPAGLGVLTASGAPDIRLNEPVSNQYKYTGPASTNPYFTTPSNPLRAGYVLGFGKWFNNAEILGGKTGPMQANQSYFATEEGAKEALRLVQQYEPEATIVQMTWGGGPYSASSLMPYISLPGENRLLNAGGLLASYYHGGSGVTTSSDADLERTIRMV